MLAPVLWLCLLQAATVPYSEDFSGGREALRQLGWRLTENCAVVPEGPDGSPCLRVRTNDGQHRYASLYLPVEEGKSYRVEVMMRCEAVEKGAGVGQNRGAVVFGQWAGHQREHQPGGTFPTGLHGTHDWQLRTVAFTRAIPARVGYLDLLLGVEGVGTAWFDDLRVTELTALEGLEQVTPGEAASVAMRRPVLEWRPWPGHRVIYQVELSQTESFSATTTVRLAASGTRAQPSEALAPGRWFWRVRLNDSTGELPPGPAWSFIVPADAPVWPPLLEPAWDLSTAPRPELAVVVGPAGLTAEVAVTIAGAPASEVGRTATERRYRPAADLPPGRHEVVVTARLGDRVESRTWLYSTLSPGSRVTIRDDGILLVDGEPFFPLGSYRDPSDTLTDFSGLQEAGFNLTHDYRFEGSATVEQARAYLAAAEAAGVKVFMGLSRQQIKSGDLASCQRFVAELMDQPALLTWYLMDEPSIQGVSVEQLQVLRRMVRTGDPFRPTSLVSCQPAVFAAEASAVDIFWTDPYPLPDRPLTMVADWADGGVAACAPGQPYWCVLQGHDIRYWHDKTTWERLGPPTRPTAAETRCMAWLAVACGAQGLIWYWQPNSVYHQVKDAPQVWAGIKATVAELRELTDWLVARRQPADEVTCPAPLRAWSREHAGGRVLVVVNPTDEPVSARVAVAGRELPLMVEARGVELRRWP